jgi:hypothetical protein
VKISSTLDSTRPGARDEDIPYHRVTVTLNLNVLKDGDITGGSIDIRSWSFEDGRKKHEQVRLRGDRMDQAGMFRLARCASSIFKVSVTKLVKDLWEEAETDATNEAAGW